MRTSTAYTWLVYWWRLSAARPRGYEKLRPDSSAVAVQTMYKASKRRFDEDAEFKDRARKAVTQLQGGDPQFVAAWQRICAASRKVNLFHCAQQHFSPAVHFTV